MSTKLNDLQMILLSHAAKSDTGHIFPLSASVADHDRAAKELKALLRRGLLTETETASPSASWRQDGEVHFGLIITKQGTTAIGIMDNGDETGANAAYDATSAEPTAQTREARTGSKIANVLTLLRRTQGATLAEVVDATGWLPHTTRAALTGLKKKGHAIDKSKRDEITCYHIAGGR